MDLISGIYEEKKRRNPYVVFQNSTLMNELLLFTSNMSFCDSEVFDIATMRENFAEVFGKSGVIAECVFLDNAVISSSRYDDSKSGSSSFGYFFTSDIEKDANTHNGSLGSSVESALENNTITYYLSNELFTEGESYANDFGIKLTSGNESLYYSVDECSVVRKYSIKLNEEFTLIREFSRDEVLFIIEGLNRCLVIRIKKTSVGGRDSNCQLDNEMLVLDYLKTLTGEYDVLDVYDRLCELSLGDDVSMYPEITISELNRVDNSWKDNNVISVKNGDMDLVIRTIGDKRVTLYGNGNWSYVLSDENVKFKIEQGKIFKLVVETENEDEMDNYNNDGLLHFDMVTAMGEVEETRELVRKRCRLENKRG